MSAGGKVMVPLSRVNGIQTDGSEIGEYEVGVYKTVR